MVEIIYGKDAQKKLMRGIDLVANTIQGTLGPKARTVILKKNNKPIVINDGVTIARAIHHQDEFIQLGVELIQEVASKTQENTGDGTTTASILTQEICRLGLDAVNDGACAINLTKQLSKASNEIVEHLNEKAIPVDGREVLEFVATIAANNDNELGSLIADVVEDVGRDGIISVEDGKGLKTTYDVIDGMELDRGYLSHVMINDIERGLCEFGDSLVLLTNSTINNFQELIPILEISVKEKKPLLIISKELEGTAFPNLLANLMQQTLRVCAIRAPDFGQDQVEMLNDIASLTGGRVFNSDVGEDWTKATLEDLGEATKITVDRNKTVIVNEDANKNDILDRVKLLKSQMNNEQGDWFKEKLHRRIGKLTGGVAVVKVGAATESELLEKKERLDDSMNATKAAVQEGVVVGGGLALFNASSELETEEDSMGKRILLKSLHRPLIQLMRNSGVNTDNINVSETVGFNALTGNYEDLWESGVIDPVKITKNAVITATSIASLVLTTEVLVGEKDEETINPIYG
tara:strand:+ start:4842 stop:6407 length:1566 start_codon:yes stop_codon:yes gene_type:complete